MEITRNDLMSGSVHLSEDGQACIIIDQTKLPNEELYLTLTKAEEFYDAIKRLAVRGAPAIGICAAYAVYVLAAHKNAADTAELMCLSTTPVLR